MIDSKNTGLITALMNRGVFSECGKNRVTSVWPNTSNDQNEVILKLVARKSQSYFFNFISALNDTNQTHLVIELIGADVVAKVKTVYESDVPADHIAAMDAELLAYMKEMFQRNGEVVARLNELLSQIY